MTLTVSMEAHKTPSETINIVAVVNNNSDESVRIGSMTSQLYEITARSDSVSHYGQSGGYLQAPHHLSLPPNESVVFSKEYETEETLREDMGDLHIDVEDFLNEIECLEPTVTETVTATVSIFIKSGETRTLESSIDFVPSRLNVRSSDEVADSLRTNPLTENSIQLG